MANDGVIGIFADPRYFEAGSDLDSWWWFKEDAAGTTYTTTLTATSGASVASLTTSVPAVRTLSCTGPGTATLKRNPARILTRTPSAAVISLLKAPAKILTRTPSAAIPVLRKQPQRTYSLTVVSVSRVNKGLLKTITTTVTQTAFLVLHRCGISPLTYSIDCVRNWECQSEPVGWSINAIARWSVTPGEIFGCD